MPIVVLDGLTLNPGDLDWGPLRALGECSIHERTPAELVVERSRDAEIVLTNKTIVTRKQMDQMPRLRYLGVLATGFNNVDAAAARERNIPVCNVPDYGAPSVAQMTVALLLELTQHVGHHAETVRNGRWSASPDFCYWDHPLIELKGLVLGVIGYGRIGRSVGNIALALGMKVQTHTRTAPVPPPPEVRLTDLDDLIATSDVTTLHCPLTDETRHLIDAPRIRRMKRGAFLINTSRGPLVNDRALAEALNSGYLAGAGLDVLSVEPPPAGNPLLSAKNCLITPHIAWATRAARARLLATAVGNLKAFLNGTPRNVVN